MQQLHQKLLHGFAVFVSVTVLCLICLGGIVTSTGSGMTVPDWPTSYGYNMFLFPLSRMVGGIFYEHSHRLLASFVGFLTIVLCLWLWLGETRRRLQWLGTAALITVIVQGVLGGLRVTLYKNEIGIFHACLAQAFLVLVAAIALFTSPAWNRLLAAARTGPGNPSPWLFATVTSLVFLQLVLGATMRHAHAGLAVPDFPTAYGRLWPDTSLAALDRINTARWDRYEVPTTAANIHVHMAHRIGAVVVSLAVFFTTARVWRRRTSAPFLRKSTAAWSLLVLVQFFLGAVTVWSNKAADIATLHVAIGALILLIGALQTIALFSLSIHSAPDSLSAIRNPQSAIPEPLPAK
jgi:cytochrome c oxidase assembly protein subunit 15